MSKNKVAIITGAANGIGREMAFKFSANDYSIVLVDHDAHSLAFMSAELNRHKRDFLIMKGDLGDLNFVNSIAAKTFETFGRIDTLVNNAAWRTIETMRTISIADWEKTISICLTAPAFLAKEVAGKMEKSGSKGVIINISSVMCRRAGGYSPAYIVCKGGMEALTYELSVLYGPSGIRVVGVTPGYIDTELSGDYKDDNDNNISGLLTDDIKDHTPLKRGGSAGEVSDVAYWLSTKEASFITGTSILVDGGFSHNFNAYQMKKLQFSKEF